MKTFKQWLQESLEDLFELDFSDPLLAEDLEELYKINYMWDYMSQSTFRGNHQREINYIKKFKRRAIIKTDEIIIKLLRVIMHWYKGHTQKGFSSLFEDYMDSVRIHEGENLLKSLTAKYFFEGSWKDVKNSDWAQRMCELIKHTPEDKVPEPLIDDYVEYLKEEWIMGLFHTEEQLNIAKEKNELEDIEQYENDLLRIKDELEEIEKYENLFDDHYRFLDYLELLNTEEMNVSVATPLLEMVYPYFIRYWSTSKYNIKKVMKDAKNQINIMKKLIHSDDLTEKFIQINRALNMIHVTGPMLDHINNAYEEINADLLKRLSDDFKVDDIQKELSMVGFSYDPNMPKRDLRDNLMESIEFQHANVDDPETDEEEDLYYQAWEIKTDIRISRNKELFAIAIDNNKTVGAIFTYSDENTYEFDVVVNDQYRRQGIASKLVDLVIADFEDQKTFNPNIKMNVLVVNENMIQLLLKKGFHIIGRIMDDVIMSKKQ